MRSSLENKIFTIFLEGELNSYNAANIEKEIEDLLSKNSFEISDFQIQKEQKRVSYTYSYKKENDKEIHFFSTGISQPTPFTETNVRFVHIIDSKTVSITLT